MLFLHKLSSEVLQANDFDSQLRKKLLPKNKNKKKKKRLLKQKGLMNRVWLYLRREVPDVNEDGALKSLNKFLMNIEDAVFDLHDAIRNIAKITKYKKQHWFKNLKELYISTDDKEILEILLHMTVLRFFTLIEESTKNGLERDYIEYMKKNKKDSKKTLEEMMFIMQILADYNKFVK
ncbi:uncharacterized protein LOC124643473 [Helicoverpa zea]|uniref:uncharacterized protein LOC124643473 n=1 Tax=Helicoverpa zea TaxID=7113 RepID=UPI001F57931A|nr:uncharacterized protein LOC124643473 [Helicoverpa zea]